MSGKNKEFAPLGTPKKPLKELEKELKELRESFPKYRPGMTFEEYTIFSNTRSKLFLRESELELSILLAKTPLEKPSKNVTYKNGLRP